MAKFEVYEAALELVVVMRPVLARIAQHDRDMVSQLKRATSSVPANISEGNQRSGKDRLHLLRIAAGSAAEVRSHLAVAQAWGDIDAAAIAPALALLDRIVAMLWRLTHNR